jgi:hypothetical protein
MSKIFDWYGKDFAVDERERLKKFAEFCSGAKKEQLLELASGKEKARIRYKAYDWTVNKK